MRLHYYLVLNLYDPPDILSPMKVLQLESLKHLEVLGVNNIDFIVTTTSHYILLGDAESVGQVDIPQADEGSFLVFILYCGYFYHNFFFHFLKQLHALKHFVDLKQLIFVSFLTLYFFEPWFHVHITIRIKDMWVWSTNYFLFMCSP